MTDRVLIVAVIRYAEHEGITEGNFMDTIAVRPVAHMQLQVDPKFI